MHLLSASYVLRAKCVLGSREIMINECSHSLGICVTNRKPALLLIIIIPPIVNTAQMIIWHVTYTQALRLKKYKLSWVLDDITSQQAQQIFKAPFGGDLLTTCGGCGILWEGIKGSIQEHLLRIEFDSKAYFWAAVSDLIKARLDYKSYNA